MALLRKLENVTEEMEPPRFERPKREMKPHDDSNWLISYADIMTLLCIFYIMMFSMAKLNTVEFEKMKKQVAEQVGVKYKSPTEDLGKFMNNVLVENGVAKDATMTSDGISVSIAFHSTLFFDTASADISDAGKAILNKLVVGLDDQQKKAAKKYKVVVEGHTDSQNITGTKFASNWELSSARATKVIHLFLDHGYTPQNLLAIGYADTQPVAEGKNADGSWNDANLAKNRRVVIRVLLPEVDSIPWKMDPPPAAPAAPATAVKTVTTVGNTTVTTTPLVSAKVAAPVVTGPAPASVPATTAPVTAAPAGQNLPVVAPAKK